MINSKEKLSGNKNKKPAILRCQSIPQPNSNSIILDVKGSNALFQPAVGLTNVFGL